MKTPNYIHYCWKHNIGWHILSGCAKCIQERKDLENLREAVSHIPDKTMLPQQDIATVDLLKNIIEDERVIDMTFFRSDGTYHARLFTVDSATIHADASSMEELIFALHKETRAHFNKDKN